MFVCNTPPTRTYRINVTIPNAPQFAATEDAIWFRIQGTIMTANDSETWTDWFTYYNDYNDTNFSSLSFDTLGTTYSWSVELTNVGPPKRVLILTQQDDSIRMSRFSVDDK